MLESQSEQVRAPGPHGWRQDALPGLTGLGVAPGCTATVSEGGGQQGPGCRAKVSEGGVQSQGQQRPGYRATVNEGQGHGQQGPGCRVVVSEGQGAGSWSARAGVQSRGQKGLGCRVTVSKGQGVGLWSVRARVQGHRLSVLPRLQRCGRGKERQPQLLCCRKTGQIGLEHPSECGKVELSHLT